MKYGHIRHTAIAIAAVLVIVALFNWATGFRSPLLATLAAVVAIIVIVLEVRHYQPKVDRKRGQWHKTKEHFVDPTSGERMDVFYNPETGERDYRPSN